MIRRDLKGAGEVVEINILTQTGVNNVLFSLYPNARVNYFEHGQGDYFFIQKIKPIAYSFYCVFADNFRKYLQHQKQEYHFVKNLPEIQAFSFLAEKTINSDQEALEIRTQLVKKGKLALILMENVQIYHVPEVFWTDYLDLCIKQVPNPEEYTFILKPHPTQSLRSIEISKDYMIQSRKMKTLVIENQVAKNYSVEVLFSLWEENTFYVFSVFSSALYYISKLYRNDQTKYYYAYDFFKKYIADAPEQFVDIYKGIETVVKNVLTENCINISE